MASIDAAKEDAKIREYEKAEKTSEEVDSKQSDEPYDSQLDLAVALGCFALSLFVYVSTLYPHVPGGDSGELIAAAYQLGVGHPPGYPLFCIVAKLFASVAHFGSVAFRMNLSMAFVGAGASAFLYLTAFHVINCRSSAVLAAGLFALNPIVWTYSSHAEVFPLNNFLVCILLYLTVRFFETKDVNVARWGALVMGLGLTNQHTMIIFEVPLALGVLVVGWRELLNFKQLSLLFLTFCLGFSVYLYLPLATLQQPYVSWGDGTTWDGFLRHLLRKEYGSFRLSADEKEPGRLFEGLEFWFKNLLEMHPPLAPLLLLLGVCASVAEALGLLPAGDRAEGGAAGAAGAAGEGGRGAGAGEEGAGAAGAGAGAGGGGGGGGEKASSEAGKPATQTQTATAAEEKRIARARERGRQRGVRMWLLGSLLFYLLFFHALANLPLRWRPDNVEIIKRFWMQPAAVECIFTGFGLASVSRLLPLALPYLGRALPVHLSGGKEGGYGASVLPVLVGAVLCGWARANWAHMDQSDNYVVSQFAVQILDLLPKSALFLTMTDLVTNSLRYTQVCHHYRQDVYVADQNLMSAEWFVDGQMRNFPGVAFPAHIYWPSRPDGFNMRMMVDNNFGKFRVMTFAGTKDKSFEDAGWKQIPYGYAEEFVRPMDLNNLGPWQCNDSMWAETVPMHLPPTPPYVNLSLTKYPEGTWEYKALDEYFIAVNRYGIYAFNLQNEYPRTALPACIYVFTQATRDLPKEKCDCSLDHYTILFKNLGHCYYQSIGKEIGNLQSHRKGLAEAWGTYTERMRAG